MSLFETPAVSRPGPKLASPEELSPNSTLDIARWWYRLQLESTGHPPNTVAAYTNDLAVLQAQVGSKPLRLITDRDIGAYLESAKRKSTRKRRLTSAREFFSFVINEKKVLSDDPTEAFYPERINLKTPIPLFEADRAKLLAAAEEDGPRSFLMVYLLLELGLNRTELLNLRREHVDFTNPDSPVVYVNYDDPRWRHKERRLLADGRLTKAFGQLEPLGEDDRLYPVRPQAINASLHRLVRAAGLRRSVTPQTLRDTFGVEQAKQGKSEDELLAVLGLASDPRNRDSVRRYLKLAQPPSEVLNEDG
jgi:integrase/recombinase XerD